MAHLDVRRGQGMDKESRSHKGRPHQMRTSSHFLNADLLRLQNAYLSHLTGSFIPRSWSPDDRTLAGTIGTRVATYSFATQKYAVLTDSGSAISASYTQWLPGGRHILFGNPANTELLVVDTVSKVVKRVFSLAGQLIRGASLARDGRQLFFSHGPEEGDIWIATMPGDS